MRLSGVVIDLDVLRAVAKQKVVPRSGPGAVSGSVVTAEVLAETARRYPECRCNEMGLEPGFPVSELITLEEGCTEHVMKPRRPWICPRLNTLRSIYRPWAQKKQRDTATNIGTIVEHFDGEPMEDDDAEL